MSRKVEISQKTIIFAALLLLGLWFLFFIRDILLQLFVAVFIMVVLNPTVRRFHTRFKIPRGFSVLVVYFSAILLIALSIGNIVPPLVDQTSVFVNSLPQHLKELGLAPIISDQLISEVLVQLRSLPGQIVRLTVSLFSNLIGLLTILIFAFYLLMSREKLEEQLSYFIGVEKAKEAEHILDELETKLGGWARGQLSLMLLVGSSSYIGLVLLNMPYALSLAIIAGILEAVPYIGPILAAFPAVIIGFGISPVMGVANIALYFLIQQVENYVFVPKVMERSVGISPIVTLMALTIGFRVAGITGVVLSVPVVITLRVLFRHYYHK